LLAACGAAPAAPPAANSAATTVSSAVASATITAGPAPTTASAISAAAATAPGAGPVKLTFMAWAVDVKWLGGWDRSTAEFNKRTSDVQVTFQWSPISGWEQKILTMISGGVAPDVVNTFASMFIDLIGKNTVIPIDSYTAASKTVNLEDFFPLFRQSGVFLGKRYGLPFSGGGSFFYYNEDMFQAAGVPLPTPDWTWQTFTDAAVKLTKRQGATVTQWGGCRGDWQSWVLSAGGKLADSTAKHCLLDSAEASAGLQHLQDLIFKQQAVPTNEALKKQDSNTMFQANTSAMGYTNSTLAQQMGDRMSFKWNAVRVPKGPVAQLAGGGVNNAVIAAASKDKAASYRFLEWITSTEELISRGLPEVTRQSQYDSPNLVNNLDPTFQGVGRTKAFVDVIVSGNGTAVTPPETPMWTQASGAIGKELANLYDNAKTASEVGKAIVQQVDPILAQWQN
jgi:multiple sugar transport system substrate-binding protein